VRTLKRNPVLNPDNRNQTMKKLVLRPFLVAVAAVAFYFAYSLAGPRMGQLYAEEGACNPCDEGNCDPPNES